MAGKRKWTQFRKQNQHNPGIYSAGLLFFLLIMGALACTLSSEAPTPLPTLISPVDNDMTAGQTGEGGEPISVANLEQYENAEMGVAFDFPAGWSLQNFPTFVAVASNATLLAENAPYIDDSALVLVAAGPNHAGGGAPPAAALDEAVADLDMATNAQIVEGPTTTTINGQEAIVAVLSAIDEVSGENIFYHITYLHNDGYGVVIAGTALQADESRFRPVFETIAGSVVLSTPQLPAADRPDAEPAGDLAIGDTVTGAIPPDGAVAWTFAGEAGSTLNILAEPSTASLDLIVDVVNAQGSSILPNGAVDDSFTVESITGLVLPAGGDYQVILTGFLGSGGDYSLNISSATSGFNVLSPGTIITGSLTGGDVDLYTLPASAGVSVTFVLAPAPELDVVLEVFNLADNTLLLSQDDGFSGEGELAVFIPERSGEYLVQVSEFSGASSGNYTINVATEAAALLAETGDLAAGEAIDFTLPFPEGETIVVAAVPDDTLDVVISLLDAEGTLLESTDVGFENAPEVFAFTIPSDGDYTLRISGFEESAGSYRLIVAGESTTPILPEETTGNVTTVLTPGRVQADTLPAAGEKVYRFTGRANDTATFFVLPEDELDVVVEITGPDGEPVLTVDQGFTGEGEVIRFTPDSAGEYQLVVRSFVAIGGDYLVGMLDEDTALLNDDGTVSNDASVGYQVTIPAGATRVIMVFPENAFDALVEIMDNNQQLVAESDIGIAGEPEILRFTAPAGGNYTVRISGFVNIGGSYSIVIIDIP